MSSLVECTRTAAASCGGWALAVLSVACAPVQPGPAPSGVLPEPRPALDRDPDPGVVEVELVAEVATVELVPGIATEVWAYRDAGA